MVGFYHDHCPQRPQSSPSKLWHHVLPREEQRRVPSPASLREIPCSRDRCFPCHGSLGSGVHGPQVRRTRSSSAPVTFAAPMTRSCLEKSSDAGVRTEAAHKKDSTRSSFLKEGTRNEPSKMLCCTTSSLARSRLKRLGTLSLRRREMHYHQGNADTMADGPPVYTTKDSLSISDRELGQLRSRSQEDFAQRSLHSISITESIPRLVLW